MSRVIKAEALKLLLLQRLNTHRPLFGERGQGYLLRSSLVGFNLSDCMEFAAVLPNLQGEEVVFGDTKQRRTELTNALDALIAQELVREDHHQQGYRISITPQGKAYLNAAYSAANLDPATIKTHVGYRRPRGPSSRLNDEYIAPGARGGI